jgi:hypothetical protein
MREKLFSKFNAQILREKEKKRNTVGGKNYE